MRKANAAYIALLACLASPTAALPQQADCSTDPNALGVSRTLEVDPTGGPRYGTYQYPSSLDLSPGEVVLTFDDGPNQIGRAHV
jgi:peptidoglycan-N-acetylglucosamine deacetylase